MKKITILQVAKCANVGKTTVSKYLNGGNVRKEYRERIETALKTLDYHPNVFAQALKSNKSNAIGIIIPYLFDKFAIELISSVEQELHKKGYSLLISSYYGDENEFLEKAKFLVNKMVDGVIVLPNYQIKKNDFEAFEKNNIPFILIDRFIVGLKADIISTDNVSAGFLGASYLINKGHKNLLIVTGNELSFTSSKRNEGIVAALKENNISEENYYFLKNDSRTNCEKQIIEEFNNRKPTAIFATNLYHTINVIKALNSINISIPKDVSLLAFDNSDSYNLYPMPLTIIAQETKIISENCVRRLLEKIHNPDEEIKIQYINASIIEGKSVKEL